MSQRHIYTDWFHFNSSKIKLAVVGNEFTELPLGSVVTVIVYTENSRVHEGDQKSSDVHPGHMLGTLSCSPAHSPTLPHRKAEHRGHDGKYETPPGNGSAFPCTL